MECRGSFLASIGAGAAATYLLDPARGSRRRARVRDLVSHGANKGADALRRPEAVPSSEAAHAALLFAHIAWNRCADTERPDYRPILSEFEESNPHLWDELKSADPEELIAELAAYRERRPPSGARWAPIIAGDDGDRLRELPGTRPHACRALACDSSTPPARSSATCDGFRFQARCAPV